MYAQNLVPNPSFENLVNCPTMESQVYLAEPWFSPIMCAFNDFDLCCSSDLYNTCHIINPPFANVSVPMNDFGYQWPRTGNGYAGIAVWIDNGARERIEVPLIDSLVKDRVYCLKMFVVNKLAFLNPGFVLTNTSNLQFLLTNDTLIDNHPTGAVYYTPSVINPNNNIISDTSIWTEISGCFLANGGEKYLTIGNFYNNANSTVSNLSAEGAYYFIDDVSVEEYNGVNCNCPEFDSLLPEPKDTTYLLANVFSPNDDGLNDFWGVNFLDNEEYTEIYNRWGVKIAHLDLNQPFWNGSQNSNPMSEGVYFYKAFLRNEFKTGFFHLVR